jgi:hypothetical protein
MGPTRARESWNQCPDARDCFDLGTSTILPEASLLAKLQALFQQLSATTVLFLILHAPKADLEAVQLLGMSTDDFIMTLPQLGEQPSAGQIYICDTQELFTGWQGQRRKEKLMVCCSILGVDTTGARPHNAGKHNSHASNMTARCFATPRRATWCVRRG